MKDRIQVLNPWEKPGVPASSAGHRQRGWRRRLVAAVVRFLRRCLVRRRTMMMPEPLDSRGRDMKFEFTSPAQGDAYSFDVVVRCNWHTPPGGDQGQSRRSNWEILDFMERSRAEAEAILEDRIRPVARQFPPYQAAEAEEALNRAVVGCFGGESDVRVTTRVQVTACEEIRTQLQKKWKERLGDVVADQWQMAHVQTLSDLQEEWRKLLVAGLEGMGTVPEGKTEWLAPYALALAENPKGAADQLRKVLQDRVDHAESLLKNLGEATLDDRIDALEFAFQSESTLRALLVYLGVPVPAGNSGPGEGQETPPKIADG